MANSAKIVKRSGTNKKLFVYVPLCDAVKSIHLKATCGSAAIIYSLSYYCALTPKDGSMQKKTKL